VEYLSRGFNVRYVRYKNLTTSHSDWKSTELDITQNQTTTTFHLVNVLSRPTHSAVYRWQQSVSCCVRSSVEQCSIACHRCFISLHLLLSSKMPSIFSLLSLLSQFLTLLVFRLFSACPVTYHFGHYNRYYIFILNSQPLHNILFIEMHR